jgi:hypothetical protein
MNTLAARFGYAFACDREPAAAISEDLRSSLGTLPSASLAPVGDSPPTVKYFEPNDSGLFAVVECHAVTRGGAKLLLELIVTGSGTAKYVTLEQISVAA